MSQAQRDQAASFIARRGSQAQAHRAALYARQGGKTTDAALTVLVVRVSEGR